MRVKVAECASLFWDDGRLVWDGFLDQRQHALTPDSEILLRWFSTWRDLDSVSDLGEGHLRVAERLVDAGVLIAENSPEHRREERILSRWGDWGAAARHLHFSTRTLTGTRYAAHEQDVEAMREQVRRDPPPAYATARPDRPLTRLPTGGGADAPWPQADLVSTLMGRRSVRRFAPEGLALGELAALLQVAGGILEVRDGLGTGPAVFKTSPAAGAWHPIELHVHARRVDGLEPGVYHYAPTRGGLEPAPAPAAEVDPLDALGGQPWLAEAPVLILFTGVIERSAWRYATARAYRDMLIGLGHVSQTTLLTATAMGLGSVFATAVCDEDLERLAGVDPVEEVLLGVTAVGRPAPGA